MVNERLESFLSISIPQVLIFLVDEDTTVSEHSLIISDIVGLTVDGVASRYVGTSGCRTIAKPI